MFPAVKITILSAMNRQSFIFSRHTPLVMGILNVTPDSFYDGGRHLSEKAWLDQAARMVTDGAAIIDIGAQSTRPGSVEVSEAEEMARVLPVVTRLVAEFPDVCVSVDTWRASVARAVIGEGARMINDISGGTFDREMFQCIGRSGVDYVLMHTRGTPATMQVDPHYDDVVAEVRRFLFSRAALLSEEATGQVVIDPGFGFGKTQDHNYELMRRLRELTVGEWPVLVGISRKSMIYKLLNTDSQEALTGTTALNLFALLQGAAILRVHDVKEATEVVKLASHLISATA